jgi:hypothetical protein
MIRFGVPADVDLRRVRKYLLVENGHTLLGRELRDYDVQAAIALLDLEKHLTVPEPSLADVLPGLSTAIGSLLLVVFCLYATLRAPRVALLPTAV